MDPASHELIRVCRDELVLPRLERDRSGMLPAGTVLREQRRPPAPVRCDDPNSAASTEPNASGHEQRNRPRCFINDVRLAVVEKDPKKVGLRRSTNATVAEIQPRQIHVRGVLVLVEGFEPPLYRF